MTESYTPNLGTILRLYHTAISRGIDTGTERSQSFAENGYPDSFLRDGFVTYLQTLSSVVRGHDLAEDAIVFPYFRLKIPEAPFAQLSAQHKEIATILDEVDAAIVQDGSGVEEKVSLRRLRMPLLRLHGIWRLHVQAEQDFFRPDKLETMLGADEQAHVVQQYQDYALEQAGPNSLAIPFLLFNLKPDDRALLAQTLPPAVVDQFVPGEWRQEWVPMLPFLLVEKGERTRVAHREGEGQGKQG